MRKLIMVIVCLMTMVVFNSCSDASDFKETNMATNLMPIFEEYSNWTDNELVVEPFKEKMVDFFKNATDKDFSTFYDGKVKFDEIVQPQNGHVNTSDSVAVRFKCSEIVFIHNTYKYFTVRFDIVGNMHKSDASRLDGHTKYYIDGNVLCFLDNVYLWRSNCEIDMGVIVLRNLYINKI